VTETWVEVGRVRSANTRSREVRVKPRAGYAYVFSGLSWIRFQRGGETLPRCKVLRTRADGDMAVVGLGPGVPRDMVGQLRGAAVVLASGEMPPKPGRAFRTQDLVGLRVTLPDGGEMGTVTEIYEGPANDAFAVEGPGGVRRILPAIGAVIRSVDLERRELRVGEIGPYVVED